jgi:hypothetical protein
MTEGYQFYCDECNEEGQVHADHGNANETAKLARYDAQMHAGIDSHPAKVQVRRQPDKFVVWNAGDGRDERGDIFITAD